MAGVPRTCISEVTGDSIDTLVRNYVHLVPGSTYNPARAVAEVIETARIPGGPWGPGRLALQAMDIYTGEMSGRQLAG